MSKAKFIQENGETILPITHEEAVLDSDGKNLPSKYQQKQDESLLTESKTIVGAINELSTKGGGEVTSDDVEYSGNDMTVTEALDGIVSYVAEVEVATNTNKAKLIIPKNNEELSKTSALNVSTNDAGIVDKIPAIMIKDIPLPIPF